jgi:tRNA G18 (ribose-2'-O)-methylase SpoU
MEKSVNTISKSKFKKLSSCRQHELLSQLSRNALSDLDFDRFLERYNELHSWAQLDRYTPPDWLSKEEALDEYLNFHLNFTSLQTEQEKPHSTLSWQPKLEVEVVLDQVRSPYNVGSILRIIDNFGLKGMVHSSSWLSLNHPQLIKAARGCEKWIPVRFEKDLVSYLKNSSLPVIGIENNDQAEDLNSWSPPEKGIIILGNESYGIASALQKTCCRTIQIPMYGLKKSMNVTHAFAVIAHKISELSP